MLGHDPITIPVGGLVPVILRQGTQRDFALNAQLGKQNIQSLPVNGMGEKISRAHRQRLENAIRHHGFPHNRDGAQAIKRGKQFHALAIGKRFSDQGEIGLLFINVFQTVHNRTCDTRLGIQFSQQLRHLHCALRVSIDNQHVSHKTSNMWLVNSITRDIMHNLCQN